MIGLRVDESTEKRLEKLAKETNRSKSFYVREALKLYLEEIEDYEIALSRLHNPKDKIISSEKMWERLNLEI